MRAAFHILAVVVLLPYLVLASGFLILGHAISSSSLVSSIDTLFTHALWVLEWGIYAAVVGIVMLTLLGIVPRYRWLGALCLAVLAAASALSIAIVPRRTFGLWEWLYLVPCIAVLLFGLWRFRMERATRYVRLVATT